MRNLRPWIVASAFAAGALLVAFTRPAPAAFQYRVVRYAGIDITQDAKKQDEQAAQLEAQLNGYAGEGWDLAFVQGGVAVLRR